MKSTPKSCSCVQCTYGKATKAGHGIKQHGERKLRRDSKRILDTAIKTGDLEVIVDPASRSGYIS